MSTLREHQITAAAALAFGPRKYLAHAPGLGKTRTLIAALQGAGARSPLVVCPAIVRTHWRREFEAMNYAERDTALVYSYAEIQRGGDALRQMLLGDFEVDALVLDEAHYLKHAASSRTLQLLGKDGYARQLDIVWPASGTPIPRNAAEIWTLLASVFPHVARKYGLASYQAFVDRYCITRPVQVRGVWRYKVVANNPDTLPELRELLGEILLVRTLDDVGLDVPDIDWQLLRLDTRLGRAAGSV
jgi:SNF2 family DNA or RNA helicase